MYGGIDLGFGKAFMSRGRHLHTTVSRDDATETLKRRITELEKIRRSKKKSKRKDDIFVQVPESLSFLDTATMPMILTVVGTALFAKLLMMYDDSHSQEMIERKIKNAPVGQGTVRMLTREEWEEFREVRPRTPFESKLARPNARIRTEEPVRTVRHPVLFVTTSLCSLADKRISITGMTVKIGSAFVHIFYPSISESIRRGYGIIVSFRPLFS
uniref:Uncharacterized protein n=1 Tax=Populus alba TaxID=43335 RepID=A0A4U5R3L0_POPAL|nr:hypothetical protein D5086_0000000510 [Populus alba]